MEWPETSLVERWEGMSREYTWVLEIDRWEGGTADFGVGVGAAVDKVVFYSIEEKVICWRTGFAFGSERLGIISMGSSVGVV
jgi:hypothetical protein